MDIERKQKIKKGLLIGYVSLTTIFTVFMIIMLAIVGVSSKKKQKASAYVQDSYYVSETYKGKVQPKYASYNDDDYVITLTAAELNNYTWNNLNAYFVDLFNNDSSVSTIFTQVNYDDNEYDFSDFSEYDENHICVEYGLDDNVIQFNSNVPNNKFYYFEGETTEEFGSNLSIVVLSSSYNDVKTAIELDIQANEKSINSGIFETLTSGIVAFIGSISAGINGMISVFWSNDSLTVIGTLSVIVVSVALVYFLFRLIIGLIRMRG